MLSIFMLCLISSVLLYAHLLLPVIDMLSVMDLFLGKMVLCVVECLDLSMKSSLISKLEQLNEGIEGRRIE